MKLKSNEGKYFFCQWVLAIDIERTGSPEEADSRILIKDQNLESLVAQEEQVLNETKIALDGK